MIGNEKTSHETKFMELFRKVSQLETALGLLVEQVAELHEAVNYVPDGLGDQVNSRKTLHLKSGVR